VSDPIFVPGAREVRGTLDAQDEGADSCVVACPPHPRHGGSRSDSRLRAVADALAERGVATLRFDYGPWDEGRGERTDAGSALDWAGERYGRVGLFGYSFGGAVALVVAAGRDDVGAVAALAPAAGLEDGSDASEAVSGLSCPALVVCGERDDTVDCAAVADRARASGHAVETLPADHHFAGQTHRVADAVAPFLVCHLSDRGNAPGRVE
jgi:alpha/beta superfamily hydrolase